MKKRILILPLLLALLLTACGKKVTPTVVVPPTAAPAAATLAPTAPPAATAAPTGTINGTIHLMAPPTPAMRVYALGKDNNQWRFVQTLPAEGEAKFSLLVPAGTYIIFGAAEDGKSASLGHWTENDAWNLATVTVAAGQTVSGITVRPPSQSECGSMLSFPASPDGRYAAVAGPTAECRQKATEGNMPQPKTEPIRIQFAAGASSARIPNQLAAGGLVPYVLNAGAGQEMNVTLTATIDGKDAPNHAILHIWGLDGKDLLAEKDKAATWKGKLPATQDYFIDVLSISQSNVLYQLEVSIPPVKKAASIQIQAKTVPVEFKEAVQTLASTGIPLMLPPKFTVGAGLPAVYPSISTAAAGEFEISLDYGKECQGGGACHYGSLTGKKAAAATPTGTRNNPVDAKQAQAITLVQNIQGYGFPSVCGANCSDAQVFWIVNGYQYSVGLKGSGLSDVVDLANAIIQNSIVMNP